MRGICLIFLALGAWSTHLPEQVADTTEVYSDVELRELLLDEVSSDEEGPDELDELLEDLITSPLNVNSASADDLIMVPWIDAPMATRIREAARNEGPFERLEQLFNVADVPPDLQPILRALLRAETVEEATRQPLRFSVIQQLRRRLDLGEGFDPSRDGTVYLGSPERITTRLRVEQARHWRLRLTLNKHAGEPFVWDPEDRRFGFSQATGHVSYTPDTWLRQVVIGDFQASAGQGLLLWRPLDFGAGLDAARTGIRAARGISPYHGSLPNNAFRGVAAEVAPHSHVRIMGFASHSRRDATLDTLIVGDEPLVRATSLSSLGRYRTLTENTRRRQTLLESLGASLRFGSLERHGGIAVVLSRFQHPLAEPSSLRDYHKRTGRQFAGISAFGRWEMYPVNLAGEVSRLDNGRLAATAAVQTSSGRLATVLWQGRYLQTGYDALYANPLSREHSSAGELGFTMGVLLRPRAQWTARAVADVHEIRWPRFRADRPTIGFHTRGRLTYTPRSWLRLYLQGDARSSQQNASRYETDTRPLAPVTRQSLRLHARYQHSDQLQLSTQVDRVWSSADGELHHGFLLSQDVRWYVSTGTRIDARLAYFDTESFASRVFAYEHDLRYSFSVPALSGQGQRRYLMLTKSIGYGLELQARYAETFMPHRSEMGSGLDAFEGNRLREVSLQLRFRSW